jgi:hypothetical protein
MHGNGRRTFVEKLLRHIGLHLPSCGDADEAFLLLRPESAAASGYSIRLWRHDEVYLPLE